MTNVKGAASSVAQWLIVLVVAPVLGFGVPMFWVWVASKMAGSDGQLTLSLATFITVTMLGTYWLILIAAGWIRTRIVGEEAVRTAASRASWNRSTRDEPLRPGDHKSDPIERLFMITAVFGFIAFQLWWIFLAGSPLPSQ